MKGEGLTHKAHWHVTVQAAYTVGLLSFQHEPVISVG
jgi:hypothetical protein